MRRSCRARTQIQKEGTCYSVYSIEEVRYNIVRMVGVAVQNNTANRYRHWTYRHECAHLAPPSTAGLGSARAPLVRIFVDPVVRFHREARSGGFEVKFKKRTTGSKRPT